jgi:flagellar biosynthesis protein FlhB
MAEHQDKDQQTEKPTQRRLEEARRKGNIPMSRDVTATMVLGLLTILLVAVGGTLRAISRSRSIRCSATPTASASTTAATSRSCSATCSRASAG